MIASHNGFIDVESEVGIGTTFFIYLPIPPRFIDSVRKNDNLLKDVRGGDETVLIVEDEELLRELLKNLLKTKGYTDIEKNPRYP